jgi:hypothetical protein
MLVQRGFCVRYGRYRAPPDFEPPRFVLSPAGSQNEVGRCGGGGDWAGQLRTGGVVERLTQDRLTFSFAGWPPALRAERSGDAPRQAHRGMYELDFVLVGLKVVGHETKVPDVWTAPNPATWRFPTPIMMLPAEAMSARSTASCL